MIGAASFDNIVAIIIFNICFSIGFAEAPGGENAGGSSLLVDLGIVAAQLAVGLVAALIFGFCMKIFNRWPTAKTNLAKFLVVVFFAIGWPILCDQLNYTTAKYIFIIVFGYMCFRAWGKDKPEKELAVLWIFIQPCLFTTIGATLIFTKIDSAMVGYSVATIFIGISCRCIIAFVITIEKKYTFKENLWIALTWIPKSGVPAALGGLTLAEANKRGIPEY